MAVNGAATQQPMNGTPASFQSTFPAVRRPEIYNHKGFRITTQKQPILKAGPIEEMTEKLGIAPPEMIFGDNFVAIDHPASGWGIQFNAYDALDRVDKTGKEMLKVAHSKEWSRSREDTHTGIKEVINPFDWSYTTDYTGTTRPDSTEKTQFTPTSTPIPLELLRRPDPIQFFDEVMLYEDELADNGIAMLSIKIRVMPSCLLLLQRFFMRLDNVLVRIRDTRVYVDFDEKVVIREYLAKEEDYEKVREQLASGRQDVSAMLRDPNAIVGYLNVVDKKLESVRLSG